MYRCPPIARRIGSSLFRGLRATAAIAPLSTAAARIRRVRSSLQAQNIEGAIIRRVPQVKSDILVKPSEPRQSESGPYHESLQAVPHNEAVQYSLVTKRRIKPISEAPGRGVRPHRRPSSVRRNRLRRKKREHENDDDSNATQVQLNVKRRIKPVSETVGHGGPPYPRPSRIARMRKQKREKENEDKDASFHELLRGSIPRVTQRRHNKLRRRAQTIAPGIRLLRLSRGQGLGPSEQTLQPSHSFLPSRQTPQARRSAYWLVNYQLLRCVDGDREDVNKTLALHRERAKAFAHGGSHQMNKRWRQMDTKGPTFGLSILIGSLAYSARQALTLLGSIPNRPSLYFVHVDSLFFLRRSRWEEIEADAKLAQRFWKQVERSRDITRWPREPIRAWHLDLLLQNTHEEEQRRVISEYLDKYDQLDDLRLLYIVDCYTRLKDIDAALSVLRRVSPITLQQKVRVEPKGLAVAPRCTNLLELESVQRDGESHSFKVLPAILELGVSPDDLMYDIVVQNSVKFELPAVAWDIFRYARAHEAVIGPQTHLMLLKDSYLRRNAPNLNEMLSIIQQSPELYQHPPINAYMVNIIRGICTYERGSGPAEALARMLAVYDKAYTRAPLARIGIIPRLQDQQGTSELPDPEALPLAFMIFSYIMVQKDEVVVTRLWRKLVSKMNQGDRELLAAARYPVFYDGFICFYSKDDGTISRALNVLRYMLASETCLPGDITWSMVIGMFLRHGKEESAEKVRQLMLRRGVPVTAKAWQQVLLSYPYTEVAQEVKRILKLGSENDIGTGRPIEAGSDLRTEIPEASESSIDVTKSQVDRYNPDEKPSPVWTVPEGLNSVFDPVEKNVHA